MATGLSFKALSRGDSCDCTLLVSMLPLRLSMACILSSMYSRDLSSSSASFWRTLQCKAGNSYTIFLYNIFCLQSIYVTCNRVFLKFEARVQIYVVVLNICCEIQSFGGNIIRFSKINSYEISFWLFLF